MTSCDPEIKETSFQGDVAVVISSLSTAKFSLVQQEVIRLNLFPAFHTYSTIYSLMALRVRLLLVRPVAALTRWSGGGDLEKAPLTAPVPAGM
jgi:hypothetical protein